MKTRYPRIEGRSPGGLHILRDGILITFFMNHPHREIGRSVLSAFNAYRQHVGADVLSYYTGPEGYFFPLDEPGLKDIQKQFVEGDGCVLLLWEHDDQPGGHRVEYRGRMIDGPPYTHEPEAVSGVAFWLPTDYLEAQGPARVKELALALARELPFTTGYVSPAFNGLMDMQRVRPLIHDLCFRYPGLDIFDSEVTRRLGTRPKGAYWLNFYGPPLLNELGGVTGLRERLPGLSVQEFAPDKVLVELGEWPEVDGDMPAYRQLARVLEPHLYQETQPPLPPDDMRRWERRFLD